MFTVPIGVTHTQAIKISLLDDRDQNLKKYFNDYFNSISNTNDNSVLPYRDACFKLYLYTYRPDRQLNFYFPMLVIPTDMDFSYVGDAGGTATSQTLEITFSIIGFEYDPISKNDFAPSTPSLGGNRKVILKP